jgi:hypothetical protein
VREVKRKEKKRKFPPMLKGDEGKGNIFNK